MHVLIWVYLLTLYIRLCYNPKSTKNVLCAYVCSCVYLYLFISFTVCMHVCVCMYMNFCVHRILDPSELQFLGHLICYVYAGTQNSGPPNL